MRKYMMVAVAMMSGAVVIPAVAQASLAGKWVTEFDIGIRNENGVETSMGKRQANITLTLKGDSVTGVWQVVPDAEAKLPAPVRLSGTRSGPKVTLKSEPVERTVNMNGEESKVKLVTTYTFELRGDTLDGSSLMAPTDGSFEGHERPFSAKRVKM